MATTIAASNIFAGTKFYAAGKLYIALRDARYDYDYSAREDVSVVIANQVQGKGRPAVRTVLTLAATDLVEVAA